MSPSCSVYILLYALHILRYDTPGDTRRLICMLCTYLLGCVCYDYNMRNISYDV